MIISLHRSHMLLFSVVITMQKGSVESHTIISLHHSHILLFSVVITMQKGSAYLVPPPPQFQQCTCYVIASSISMNSCIIHVSSMVSTGVSP